MNSVQCLCSEYNYVSEVENKRHLNLRTVTYLNLSIKNLYLHSKSTLKLIFSPNLLLRFFSLSILNTRTVGQESKKIPKKDQVYVEDIHYTSHVEPDGN